MLRVCISFLAVLLFSVPSFPMTQAELDDLNEIISHGTAKQSVQQYIEEAKQFEKEANLKKAAESYFKAAKLSRASGNYQKGIFYGERASDLGGETGYPEVQARAVYEVARSCNAIADFEKALPLFEKASVLASRVGLWGLEANSYAAIGNILRKFSKFDQALVYQKKAYDRFEILVTELGTLSAVSPGPRAKHARSMSKKPHLVRVFVDVAIDLGDTYAAMDDFSSAMDLYDNALKFAAGIPDKKFKVYLSIGNLYSQKKDYQKALEYHKKSLELADALHIPSFTASSYGKTALDYRMLGKLEDAVRHYAKAIEAIEDQRTLLQSDEMRSSFFEQMVQTYDGMVYTLTALGKKEEAFNFSERGRARAFLDMIGNRVELARTRDKSLAEEEKALKGKIADLTLRAEENNADVTVQIDEAKKQYDRVLEELRKDDSEHASLVSVEPLALKDLQAMLKPGQALIEFHVLKEAVIAWYITKDEVQSSVSKQGIKTITDKITAYRESIESITSDDRSLKVKTALNNVPDVKTMIIPSGPKVEVMARDIYSVLFGGVNIPRGMELIIVPHDILHYLPFHALVLPNGRFLLEEHPMSYLSSASLMKFTVRKRKKTGDKLLAFGNPDLGNPLFDLGYAEKEVNSIRDQYPQSQIYVRKEATRERALQISDKFDLIHFATHGEYNDEAPLMSALRLSPAGQDDGKLTAEDIFKMKINASLVVLSACETALGKIKKGDEIIGFTRAIIYAGAPSVITTLWQVSDVATYMLMQDFYYNLKKMRKVEALRTAQLNLMKKYRNPFFWGAFVLTGDPE